MENISIKDAAGILLAAFKCWNEDVPDKSADELAMRFVVRAVEELGSGSNPAIDAVLDAANRIVSEQLQTTFNSENYD